MYYKGHNYSDYLLGRDGHYRRNVFLLKLRLFRYQVTDFLLQSLLCLACTFGLYIIFVFSILMFG